MLGSCRNIFGNVRKLPEIFLEIRVVWVRKSHAFVLGNVGRYIKLYWLFAAVKNMVF